MSFFGQCILDVISKSPEQRNDTEINQILPWLVHRISIMTSMSHEVLTDIVRHCEYRRIPKNDVIVRQGQHGQEFFILLSGKASVYIDGLISGETAIWEKQKEEEREEAILEAAFHNRGRRVTITEPPGENKPRRISSTEPVLNTKAQGSVKLIEIEEVHETGNSSQPKQTSGNQTPRSRRTSATSPSQSREKMLKRKSETVSMMKKEPVDIRSSDDVTDEDKENEMDEGTKRATQYGEFMRDYKNGDSFGEMALLSADAIRNATVVSDEETDLMVVSKSLFDDVFKGEQNREMKEREDFIEGCPLFNWWHPRLKNLLRMSLRREKIAFGHTLMEQGEAYCGLQFILKGEAKVSVNLKQHIFQFPNESAPKRTQLDDLIKSKEKVVTQRHTQQNRINVRRKSGYLAAENMHRNRFHDITTMGPGDIIGDIELVMNFGQYVCTVDAITDVDTFILDTKNIDRFLNNKKQSQTIDLLSDYVCFKTQFRLDAHPNLNMPLFANIAETLWTRLEEREQQQLSIALTGGILPPKAPLSETDKEAQRLVRLYLKDRAPMITPWVPRSIFHMTKTMLQAPMWRRRLKERDLERKSQWEKKMRSMREPRSIQQLKSMVEAEGKERSGVEAARIIAKKKKKATSQSAVVDKKKTVTIADGADHVNGKGVEVNKPTEKSEGGNLWLMLKVFGRLNILHHKVQEQMRAGTPDTVEKKSNATVVAAASVFKSMLRPHSSPQVEQNPMEMSEDDDEVDDELNDDENEDKEVQDETEKKDKKTKKEKAIFDKESSDVVLSKVEAKLEEFFAKYPSSSLSAKLRQQAALSYATDVAQPKQVTKLQRYALNPDLIPLPGGTVLVRTRPCQITRVSASHSHMRHFVLPSNALDILATYHSTPAASGTITPEKRDTRSLTSGTKRVMSAAPK